MVTSILNIKAAVHKKLGGVETHPEVLGSATKENPFINAPLRKCVNVLLALYKTNPVKKSYGLPTANFFTHAGDEGQRLPETLGMQIEVNLNFANMPRSRYFVTSKPGADTTLKDFYTVYNPAFQELAQLTGDTLALTSPNALLLQLANIINAKNSQDGISATVQKKRSGDTVLHIASENPAIDKQRDIQAVDIKVPNWEVSIYMYYGAANNSKYGRSGFGFVKWEGTDMGSWPYPTMVETCARYGFAPLIFTRTWSGIRKRSNRTIGRRSKFRTYNGIYPRFEYYKDITREDILHNQEYVNSAEYEQAKAILTP